MSRLIQILRNTFIRIEALFSVVFKSFLNFWSNLFRVFGFSNSQYFLETDAAKGVKRNITEESVKPEPTKPVETPPNPLRRRPNPQMDYYRKMAQEVNKK